jgi:hypothetical protein
MSGAELLMFKGILSELSPEEREQVVAAHSEMKAIITKYGDAGHLAFAQIGLEMQEEAIRLEGH